MITKILTSIEDKNHPLLGPTLWGLKLYGLWRPSKGSYSINNLVHLGGTLFIISQFVELWNIRSNIALAFHNLSVALQSTLCILKVVTFVVWKKSWSEIINYVSTLELSQLSTNDEKTKVIMKKYTKYSRFVTYFYWAMLMWTMSSEIFTILFTLLLSPKYRNDSNNETPYPEIFCSWTPFDRTRGLGYWLTFVLQSWFCYYAGGISSFYDTHVVVLLNFFAGQMELLSLNCSRLFDNSEEMTNEEALQRIKDCHKQHLSLLKHCKILNRVLSPVMFLYVIICSLMICMNAVQMTSDINTQSEKVRMAVYLLALVFQLFFYCWHSNEVLIMSERVDEGVYRSDWWSRDVKIRRCMLLLGGQLRKTIYFAAGPFVNLNMPTFIAIMKGAYSYYTLLSQIK